MQFASFVTTVFVQPVFNLLSSIYALIPGHNFGFAIIIFTVLVRMLMYPLLKKQLLHTLALRRLQPDLKRIKQEAAGNRQKEAMLTMELYKEREINPFASIGLILVQIPLFLALFASLNRIVKDSTTIVSFSYSWVQDLSWMRQLAEDISRFDNTLFGIVDLSKPALGTAGIYWPAMLIVALSAVTSYYQIKQTSPTEKDARRLRDIFKEAGQGKTADQSEVNAALSRNMSYIFPVMIFIFSVTFAAALALYWFVSSLVAFIQQDYLLRQDKKALLAAGETPTAKKRIAEAKQAEVVADTPKQTTSKKTPNKGVKRKKRR